jgi:hypothetical protein
MFAILYSRKFIIIQEEPVTGPYPNICPSPRPYVIFSNILVLVPCSVVNIQAFFLLAQVTFCAQAHCF